MRLTDILKHKRKHGSHAEAIFLQWMLGKIEDMGYTYSQDGGGNVWVELDTPSSSPFLFAAHIDTHHKGDENYAELRQVGTMIELAHSKDGCLGADDGVGIYTNLKMMEAGVKGTYVFTRGEECGGIGAKWIADNLANKLEQFKLCVEVDRAGKWEIITHQCYGQCASDSFAYELAEQLNMGHAPSDMGVYTDNCEWAHIIPECVNIAAGYEAQHTPRETVDSSYVERLTCKLMLINWHSLVIERNPAVSEDYQPPYFDTIYKKEKAMDEYVYLNPEDVAAYLMMMDISIEDIESTLSILEG